MMDAGEQTTGTRDEHYDLVSVLYHALQGADTCNVYALDAEAAGDERLAAFFREAGVVQTQLAERAKGLLGIRGGVAPGGVATPRTAEPGTAVPPEGVAGPGGAPTDVRRGSEPEPPPPGTGRVPSREESVAGDVPPRTEPSLAREGTEEAPPPRTEERLPGTEGTTPPRTEDVSPRTEESAPPGREGTGREQEEEDRGLLDRARDALLGEEEGSPRRRREEGTDRPDRR
jgi:hypothetical protein